MRLQAPPPAEEEDESASRRSDLDKALKALLVDEARVKIDPATGEILDSDGENRP